MKGLKQTDRKMIKADTYIDRYEKWLKQILKNN